MGKLELIGKRRWRKGHQERTLNLPSEVFTADYERCAEVYYEKTDDYLILTYKFPRRKKGNITGSIAGGRP